MLYKLIFAILFINPESHFLNSFINIFVKFVTLILNLQNMGKGDKKTKRGKIIMGSYGKLRPKNSKIVKPVLIAKTESEPIISKPKAKKAK